jgi:small subunit ribosomal protein S7
LAENEEKKETVVPPPPEEEEKIKEQPKKEEKKPEDLPPPPKEAEKPKMDPPKPEDTKPEETPQPPKVDEKPKEKEEKKEEPPAPEKEEKKEPSETKPKKVTPTDKIPEGTETKPKEKKGGEKKEDEGKSKETQPKSQKERDELYLRFSPLIFGKYDLSEVVVEDPGLRRYINLAPVGLPHTGAKHANKSFGKTKVNIVERLINNMMRTEHTTGKKAFAYRTVSKSFDIIQKRTKINPVQVLINALQNSSPKEEITRLRFGGISVPKAVDTSSSHRLDVALRNICKGAVSSSHRNKKRMEVCLAEEIILASKADMNSFAISKKEEMERIAASAR